MKKKAISRKEMLGGISAIMAVCQQGNKQKIGTGQTQKGTGQKPCRDTELTGTYALNRWQSMPRNLKTKLLQNMGELYVCAVEKKSQRSSQSTTLMGAVTSIGAHLKVVAHTYVDGLKKMITQMGFRYCATTVIAVSRGTRIYART